MFILFFQSSGKQRTQKTEAQVAQLQSLQSYLTFVKLSKTIDRNVLMIEAMKKQLPVTLQETANAAEPDPSKKLTKPEDLVRIYDIILQVFHSNGDLYVGIMLI